jgi:hypothetical protein
MPTLGREFLQSLANPPLNEGLFNLGASIGGIPGQYQAKKKEEADKVTAANTTQGIMAGIQQQDPVKLEAVAEQLRLANQPVKAMQVFNQAQTLKEKLKLEKEKQTLKRGERSLVDFATASGMDLNDPKAKEFFFRRANIYGVDPTRASALFDQFVTAKKGTNIISAGASLVDDEGNVIFTGAFKPSEPKAPNYKVTSATKQDPNIRVFRNGEQIEVIPINAGESESDAASRLVGVSKLVGIKQTVNTLLGDEYQASGISGAVAAKWIPGTDARDRDRLIQSLRSNLGLEAIADLKALSSTGSTGLGQVSNIELNALQSAVASLDVSMSAKAQEEALDKIFIHINRAQMAMAGVPPKDTIEWNSPTYVAAGFSKSKKSGEIYYSPTGPSGQVYRMNTAGMFVPI